MKVRYDNFQEKVKKERKRRKIRIFRHVAAILIMAAYLVYRFFFDWDTGLAAVMLMAIAFLIIAYSAYSLYKDASAMSSLLDELHFEDGDIIKYNPNRKISKLRIPIENVEKVYFNIENKPNLLFVVYNSDIGKRAESFYKQRIRQRDKFIDMLKEKDLFRKDPILFKELKEEVEGA